MPATKQNSTTAPHRWRHVTDAHGAAYVLAARRVVGQERCPGEAHDNLFVDHCSRCAPAWGVVPTYAPINLATELRAGFAVPVDWVDQVTADEIAACGYVVDDLPVRLVSVSEKLRYATSHFYVYARGAR